MSNLRAGLLFLTIQFPFTFSLFLVDATTQVFISDFDATKAWRDLVDSYAPFELARDDLAAVIEFFAHTSICSRRELQSNLEVT